MNHTLSLDSLRFLAELVARYRGMELVTATAITPEGEEFDLLKPKPQTPPQESA